MCVISIQNIGRSIPLTTKMFFSVITKNLKWEILTKNLVTFKRWDGIQDEKCYYYGGFNEQGFPNEVDLWGGGDNLKAKWTKTAWK